MTGYESKKAMAQAKLDSMEREALKLALEVLQFNGNIWHMDCKKDEAITAIKEALAQPAQPIQQEPVAWADIQKEAQQIVESKFLWKKFIDGTPLSNDIACWMADFAQQYTAPPQRKPLTESQIIKIINTHTHADDGHEEIWVDGEAIARAIEAAHGIKEKNNGT